MNPETLKNTLKIFHSLHRPALVEGPPGGGKTQTIQQVAKELGVAFLHFHAPTMQPEDFAIPAPNAARTGIDFLINSRFPIVGSDHPDEGIILIDEAPQADNSIQKTVANLVQEREIYGTKLKPGWTIFMTGNRQSDRAGANRILSHLRNRVTTLPFDTSVDDWVGWAIDHDIRPELIGFVKFKPGMLHDFKPDMDINPTPRAWAEGVSPILDVVPHAAEMECIAGAVGEGAAGEFKAFLNVYRKLPNPDDVIAHPDKHAVPEETSVKYALSSALAYRATSENFGNIMQFMSKMPKEYGVLVAHSAIRKDSSIQQTKAFINWAVKEGASVLL